ncbi:hypothetical protein BKK39_16525 [Bacillus cereus]|uniref:immunity protein YezG family protein n=1 Tax=Bacillus paranthracis TaxID=2026186 RepID=UPI00097651DB|nr:hypothetical protein BKK39_16525 [Bacillus cereus]
MQTEKMEELYGVIANYLNSIIPVGWKEVYLYAEIDDFSNETFFYFYPNNGSEPIYSLEISKIYNLEKDQYMENLFKLNDYVEKLREEFKDNNQPLWSNLTFELTSSGKFNIDYDYTDLDNCDYDDYERHVIWKYKKLNKLPDENNEFDKEIIEKYKKKR